ncbi:hypothetical protein FRC03_011900 [Tulasnella sp. 419]|nr:hypothetical protein FRC02_011095 [Tulasnella sp. 418]KAG8953182.1 hypothetical protein FRC03_011900 [Tulasnella sp. 419]
MTQGKDVDYDEDLKWDWKEHFGRAVNKDDPVWNQYVQVATSHDAHMVGTINNSMDILLIFSGLFSAVAVTLIVQSDGGLGPEDKTSDIMLSLAKLLSGQLDLVLQILAPSRRRPAFANIDSSDDDVNWPVLLWYISLYGSLLVSGGAVCVKIWLLGYQRSTNKAQVPYHRAVYHQQSYANLQRWYIPEFGDLLACIMLFNLVPFFYGW